MKSKDKGRIFVDGCYTGTVKNLKYGYNFFNVSYEERILYIKSCEEKSIV